MDKLLKCSCAMLTDFISTLDMALGEFEICMSDGEVHRGDVKQSNERITSNHNQIDLNRGRVTAKTSVGCQGTGLEENELNNCQCIRINLLVYLSPFKGSLDD